MRRPLLLMIIVICVALVAVPKAYSYYCVVQIDKVDYPNSVSPGQSFQVNTHLTASCPVQLSASTSVRVDIVDAPSNIALSSELFATDYAFAHGGASVSGVVTNNLNAPAVTGSWSLLVEAMFYHETELMSAAQQPFTIQVGSPQPPEPLATMPILQNGGFENGTADWQLMQGSSGYDSVSTSVVLSGSHALATTLTSPPPGSNLLAPSVVGVSQTVSVSNLRGLTIDAWYVTQILTAQAAARLRVKINGLTMNYYVRLGPLTSATSGDTDTSKSLFISNWDCISWCEISRDVGLDFRTMFSTAAVGSIFSSGQATVTVALELLGYGVIPSSQFIFWDDVQSIAQIPAPTTNSSTITTMISTSVLTPTNNQTSAGEVETQSTLANPEPTTNTATISSMGNGTFLVPYAGELLIGIIAIIAVAFMVLHKKPNVPSHLEREFGKQYCTNCGSKLPQNARYCGECGSSQAE